MVGDLLRAEREKQGMTIKDIENGTSIRSLYIESIESGKYEVLPGAAYVKGFIRNYASFLRMDADAVIAEYKEEQGIVKPAVPEAETQTAQTPVRTSQPSYQAPAQPRQKPVSILEHHDDDFKERVAAARASHTGRNVCIGVLALAVVAGGAYFLLDDDSSTAPAKPAAQQTAPAKPAAPQETASAPQAKKALTDVDIKAKFKDRCWTEVKVDGKTAFEGTVEKGKTMSWKGKDKVEVRFGNAGAVELTQSGQDLGTAGDVGAVVSKTFTKEGEAGANAGKTAAQAETSTVEE